MSKHETNCRSQRGSTLLFVAIALAVLAIIGLAAVEFTGRDLGMARTDQRRDAVDRCASAARRFMEAQYRQSGGVPQSAQLMVALNAAGGEPTVQLLPNHHVNGLVADLPDHWTDPPPLGGRDRTNGITVPTSPGGGTSASVLCRELTPAFPDGGGRESEFEFYFQPTL